MMDGSYAAREVEGKWFEAVFDDPFSFGEPE